jgi:hypothetical protein
MGRLLQGLGLTLLGIIFLSPVISQSVRRWTINHRLPKSLRNGIAVDMYLTLAAVLGVLSILLGLGLLISSIVR